jgi:NAD-dependent histone deacetylase SIR2/mono-ADP-ribosyltransferase sirtuin 6
VNLQKTPLDDLANVRVYAMCDDFMKLLMEKLKIKVESFVLSRLLRFKINKNK